MTNQSIINAFLTSASAVASMKPTTSIEEELIIVVNNELLQNEMLLTLQKDGLQKSLFIVSKEGFTPTIKGWDMLFGQPQPKAIVTSKKVPIQNFSNRELVNSVVEGLFTLCHRTQQETRVNDLLLENKDNIYSAIECMVEKLLSLEPQPVVEVKPKTRKKKVVETA